VAAAAAVEVAACAGPHTACGGAGVDIDGPCLAGVELPAATGDGRGPDGERALVGDVEGGGVRDGEEEREEEEEGGEGCGEAHIGFVNAREGSLECLFCSGLSNNVYYL